MEKHGRQVHCLETMMLDLFSEAIHYEKWRTMESTLSLFPLGAFPPGALPVATPMYNVCMDASLKVKCRNALNAYANMTGSMQHRGLHETIVMEILAVSCNVVK